MAPVVTMRQLLESGVHFGHQTRRWNPKMKRFIFTERNGIYIIDLQQSLDYIDRAYEFVKETVAHGGTVLFVGTKKQAQEAIAEQARRVGMPYVNQRWLGGMLTNFSTVYKRLQRLKELEEIDFDDVAGVDPDQEGAAPARAARGTSSSAPSAASGTWPGCRARCGSWTPRRSTSRSARRASWASRSIAILDTNCDPDEVDYPIPGNDDAIRSVALLTRVIADAVADGLIARSGAAATDDKPVPTALMVSLARPSRWPSGSGSCSRARPTRAATAQADGAATAGTTAAAETTAAAATEAAETAADGAAAHSRSCRQCRRQRSSGERACC